MNAQEQAELEDKMQEFLMSGGTMHELYGITEEELEALYTKGFQEYNAQQYEKAMETFAYLIYLKPDEKRYLFAFGAVLQVIKDYKKAIYYYSMAADQDILDPTITLHIVECLVALDMHSDALDALAILLQETASAPQWAGLYAKALAYQTLLTQKDMAEK
jgi:type III secretion system low calcium response chaperone LcrH/SycD